MKALHRPQPLFVAGDIDGFFGLAIDNLIQFLLIISLCVGVLGFPMALLIGQVLPAAALNPLALATHDKVLMTIGAVKLIEERLQ